MNTTEAIEVPDYVPTQLTPLEEATLDKQHKNYALPVIINKVQKASTDKLIDTNIYFVIKDNEFYFGGNNQIRKTTDLAAAKFFDFEDAAAGYLKRKKNTPEF